jgi:hypothetical protein
MDGATCSMQTSARKFIVLESGPYYEKARALLCLMSKALSVEAER